MEQFITLEETNRGMEETRILIIDVDLRRQKFFKESIFYENTYQVEVVPSVKEGLEYALSNKPDLILFGATENSVQDLNFLNLLQKGGCSSPVILLIEINSQIEIVDAFRKGIKDFITFPADREFVLQKVLAIIAQNKENERREYLDRQLIRVEAIQITMTTLSHYLNNYLTSLDGNFILLSENPHPEEMDPVCREVLQKSKIDLQNIKTVIRVLVNTKSVSFTQYDDSMPMIDIRSALSKELNKEVYL